MYICIYTYIHIISHIGKLIARDRRAEPVVGPAPPPVFALARSLGVEVKLFCGGSGHWLQLEHRELGVAHGRGAASAHELVG